MFFSCMVTMIVGLPLAILTSVVVILQQLDTQRHYTMQVNIGYSIIGTYILILSALILINLGVIGI